MRILIGFKFVFAFHMFLKIQKDLCCGTKHLNTYHLYENTERFILLAHKSAKN